MYKIARRGGVQKSSTRTGPASIKKDLTRYPCLKYTPPPPFSARIPSEAFSELIHIRR